MKTLRGRSIGLKATMTKEQMKKHLIDIRRQWLVEGFSEQEVENAILSKTHPLLNGYYWARYPEACERLAEAMQELGYQVGKAPRIPVAKKPAPARKACAAVGASLLAQFEDFLS